MLPYIAEFLGTMILILLGCGVVANVNLEKSGMKGAGPIQITIAWGLAVMVPAYIFGSASGAHFNPALTIALAVDGTIDWSLVPGYVIAQFAGAFLGACLVFILLKGQFDLTENGPTKRGVFCTAPGVRNLPYNILQEAIATFWLVFAIKAACGAFDLGTFGVFLTIVSCGTTFGGLTGYAMNAARDTAPRLAFAILPIKGKGDADWAYGLTAHI